jgi:hypothetical protein
LVKRSFHVKTEKRLKSEKGQREPENKGWREEELEAAGLPD